MMRGRTFGAAGAEKVGAARLVPTRLRGALDYYEFAAQ
jgi:hypothetical protein